MTPVPEQNTERSDTLLAFGYSPREATFLSLAALHGGYFLRRQYTAFLGGQDGGTVSQLIEKAVRNNHVQASTYRHKLQVYHLCARPFYAALDQSNNRNRRRRAALTIKNKLMCLDFVLEHRTGHYLATEKEKTVFFTTRMAVPISVLPCKLYSGRTGATTARYFIEKYPIFWSDASARAAPVVSFCFVDEGAATRSHFETYLSQYAALFAFLPGFRLIYVAATPAPFSSAEQAFGRFIVRFRGGIAGPVDPDARRILDHFDARQLYEAKQFAAFDRARLIRFRNEQQEFAGPENDVLYERWKQVGERAVLTQEATEARIQHPMNGTFLTHLLRYDYDIFGHFVAS